MPWIGLIWPSLTLASRYWTPRPIAHPISSSVTSLPVTQRGGTGGPWSAFATAWAFGVLREGSIGCVVAAAEAASGDAAGGDDPVASAMAGGAGSAPAAIARARGAPPGRAGG